MLKALADETRMHIVRELLRGAMNVTGITEKIGASQYNVSKHLRVLREAGIVTSERQGTSVTYSILPAFRARLASKKNVLDLGCCSFRFEEAS